MALLKLRSQNKAKGCVCEEGKKEKGDGVGGDGNETHSIHASVIAKHVTQRLFLYCLQKCRRNIFGQIWDLEKKPSRFYFIDRD